MSTEMPPFNAAIIDFDGVIADSIKAHTAARLTAFDELGLGDIPDEIHQEAHQHGSHPAEIIGWILHTSGKVTAENPAEDPLTHEVMGRKKEVYRELCLQGLDPIDGSIDFINYCHETFGTDRTTIATTAHRDEVDAFFDVHQLRPVGFIASEESIDQGRMKPDPQVYELCLDYLGPDTRAFSIEDSPRGIQSSVAAAVDTSFGVTTTHARDQLLASGADQVVDTFRELIERV